MDLAEAVTGNLERLRAAGRVEVRENGDWVATAEHFQYELRRRGDLLLLHLWSENRNLVRRILRVEESEKDRLTLEVSCYGRTRGDRLQFIFAPAERPHGRVLREQFSWRFRDLLARSFPDEQLTSLTTAPDLERSLSGNYARGVLRRGSNAWAVMGAAPGENAATYDGALTFGLLWLDRARRIARNGPIAGLRLFCPEEAGRGAAHRLQAFSKTNPIEIYEYDVANWRCRRIDPSDCGNVDAWLVPRREMEELLIPAKAALQRLLPSSFSAVTASVVANSRDVLARYRGLPFALCKTEGIFYGTGDTRRSLTPERHADFIKLVRDLETHRAPAATDTKHPLYRAQPERWLESLIAEDPTRVDARLDARFFYEQLPALSGGDRGVLDALAVTKNGRLAVIEFKASEDLQLPMQAVDYWLRVRWHQQQEDFARYGYFAGIELDTRPPMLFLVAPALRFHPASDLILKYLSPEIEVFRVGVSEHWRRGIRVVLRQGRSLIDPT